MTIALAPNQSAILKALRSFLLGILPSKVEVILAQVNRVPEPKAKDFVLMTPIRRDRLETNVDSGNDACVVGSIAGNVLTVTAVLIGALQVGATLYGSGLSPNTSITSFVSGTGGVGTYKVSPSQAAPSQKIGAGSMDYLQPTRVVIQLDVHGPNGADNAQIISTLFRDDYAVQQFATSGIDVSPLYADDPKQLPFLNAEEQYEDRWVVEAHMQANEIVTAPQQFADSLVVGLIDVDERYPAS